MPPYICYGLYLKQTGGNTVPPVTPGTAEGTTPVEGSAWVASAHKATDQLLIGAASLLHGTCLSPPLAKASFSLEGALGKGGNDNTHAFLSITNLL